MPDQSNPKNLPDDNTSPSEYVRLEADLIAGSTAENLQAQKKTILIYCWSHDLLLDISNELKSVLEPEVEVLITTDRTVAQKLIKSGEIDLLLHGPFTSNLSYPSAIEQDEFLPALGSALIMLQSSNEDIVSWIKDPDHSRHLTTAMSRLNGNRNAKGHQSY
ncbi:hypothetical protein [Rhodohalobacter sp.]|uniref:hypothetical protein n=1 Tax=Rhodohalobacter sp. TaxID=1974210 RepID=UPI002ACD9F16|nr:hypothetical protein [Rhodohalobacter sp.]MDZ7755071.1 hypothetical protein [Rhodohalobacter sp.]